MDDEKQGTNKETPESEIKIIVTEEQLENADDPENTDESPVEKDKPDETKEENDNVVDETEGAASDESDGLKVPEYDFDSRRESTLLEMDKKHAWLSKLEQKCVNLETDFISRIQYVAISNHCQNYLEQLSSDESTHFRIEFSKLFGKFRLAFVESQRHINKINEIKSYKNIANSENRKLKIELENESKKIQELRENLDEAHYALRHMEKQNKTLQNMFNEISEEKGKDITKDEQATVNKPLALQDDDEADAKIRQLEEELELIGNELEFIKQRESMYQKKIQNAENTKASLQKELNSVKYEFQKQTTRAEKAEAAALENAEDVKNKNAVIKSMTEEIKQMTEGLGRAKDESKRLLKDLRICQKDLDGTAQVTEKLRRDLDIREDKIKMLVTQRDSLTIELSNKQSEISALKGDIAAITKVRNSLSRRVALLEERCSDADKKLDSAKKESAARIKELDLIKKELEESDSKTRELIKQKDALTEEAMKLEQTISELENEIKVLRDKGYSLEKELAESKRFADLLTDKIKLLEKAKARLLKEIAELNKDVNDLRDEIKRLELIIANMKKSESKLRQQLNDEYTRYELLADDERHCRKQLAESKHECEQLRDDQILLRKHIEQLQSYNKDLDDRCKKLDLNVKHLTEQLGNAKESYKQEVKNSDDLKVKLQRKEDQEQLLMRNLSEKDHDIFTFKRKAKNLTEEKNVQNAKIIEKDRQINDLKENLRLLQQELTALDKTVNERINDIKLLKIQISQMNKSNILLNEQLEFIDDTRQELVDAQSKLIEEKVKSKNLEGEMQKPVNLHRWRILEGIDPERAQLVAKNQVLQKQLNKKMAELESKEVELREKEKESRELQDLLKRRTECDSQEQLWICKKELKARMERLKCLVAENDMFQNLCKKYEDEISALKNKLRAHKISELKRRTAL